MRHRAICGYLSPLKKGILEANYHSVVAMGSWTSCVISMTTFRGKRDVKQINDGKSPIRLILIWLRFVLGDFFYLIMAWVWKAEANPKPIGKLCFVFWTRCKRAYH